MTADDLWELKVEIKELRDQVAEVASLQREANGRTSRLEGRVTELELWRARFQGAAATSKGLWLVAGGAATALFLDFIR